MFRSKRSALLIQLALTAAFARPVYAASLGELRVNSGLGQALSAKIRVNAPSEEIIDQDCFEVTLHDGDSNGPLRKAIVDFATDKAGGGWLGISSDVSLVEPIALVSVHMHCSVGADLRRDYTFFLDPPIIAPVVVNQPTSSGNSQAANRPVTSSNVQPSIPAALAANERNSPSTDYTTGSNDTLNGLAQQRYPNSPDTRRLFVEAMHALNPALPASADAPLAPATHLFTPARNLVPVHPLVAAKGEWMVHDGESFFSIVRKLYPDQSARKKVLVALMRKLNPDLPLNGEAPLPPGTRLNLPTRLDKLPSADEIKQRQAANATLTPPAATAHAALATPQSMIAATPSANATPALPNKLPQDRLIISGGKTIDRTASPEVQQMELREANLSDQLTDDLAKLHETNFRIEKLEKRMNSLMAELAKRDLEIQAAKEAEARQAKLAQSRQWRDLAIGAAAGSVVLLTLVTALHRLSRRKDKTSQAALLTEPSVIPKDSALWDDINQTAPEKKWQRSPSEHAEPPTDTPKASDMDVLFLSNIASEAALLAAHGHYKQGVELLQEEIEHHPTQLVNWMQLLELYYEHQDVAQFVALATTFHERFASEALWEKVSRMGRYLAPDNELFKPVAEKPPVPPRPTPSQKPPIKPELSNAFRKMSEAGSNEEIQWKVDEETDLGLTLTGGEDSRKPSPTPDITIPISPTPEPLDFDAERTIELVAPQSFESDPKEKATTQAAPKATTATPPAAKQPLVEQARADSPVEDDELIFEFEPSNNSKPVASPPPAKPVKAEADNVPSDFLDLTGIVIGSMEHAKRLINAGRREEGAALLEHMMMEGSLDERLAAAEMLVQLTSPR